MAKQEQNLIKLDEFNIQQLPELQNKKQEVSVKLEQFKYVEIEVAEEVAQVMNTFNKVDEEIIHEVDFEETWADILEKFSNSEDCRFINDAEEFCNWLSENYNVPTKK